MIYFAICRIMVCKSSKIRFSHLDNKKIKARGNERKKSQAVLWLINGNIFDYTDTVMWLRKSRHVHKIDWKSIVKENATLRPAAQQREIHITMYKR